MNEAEHYRRLERMYLAARINEIYQPRIEISEGGARIEIALSERLHHAAGAVHGSVYFKMLDDAAFFAANSFEPDVFVLTAAFTTYLTRPVSSGALVSVGCVASRLKSQYIAEATVHDGDGNEVGRGNGIFVRSKIRLEDAAGYAG